MTVVDGKVVAIVEDNLQLGRRILRLQYLVGYLTKRLVIDAINRVVQCRVRVADAVRRNVDLFDARRIDAAIGCFFGRASFAAALV